eukprot:jgi/Botrbrau1/21170/Bobra.0061s0062.1
MQEVEKNGARKRVSLLVLKLRRCTACGTREVASFRIPFKFLSINWVCLPTSSITRKSSSARLAAAASLHLSKTLGAVRGLRGEKGVKLGLQT